MSSAPPTLPGSMEDLRSALREVLGAEAAATTWLVGGIVRDALLERDLVDIDLATSSDPAQIANVLARALDGAAFPLGEDHGCWRVTLRADGGRRPAAVAHALQVDVCALRGSTIDEDVDLRDFTANALAVPVAGEPTIVDRCGGVSDLRDGVVRMVSERSLDDDPLRMLRAARVAHVLDWHVEDATAAAIRARAQRAVEPAGERTFAELEQLLLHPEARRGWRLLEQLGLDAVLLPELDSCRGIAQSRFHHLDVHDHTLAVLDNCEDLLAATDFWLPLAPDVERPEWTRQQRLTVLLAALAHDLGKPGTRALRADGRVSFVGHDALGGDIVDTIAERWRWSSALRSAVRKLVTTHLDLGFVLHTPAGPRERWRLMRTLDPVVPEAVVLSVGDRLATAGPDDRRKWVRAHLELARAVFTDAWRERAAGQIPPLLDGQELAQLAGLQPGPQIGQLVRALAEEQAVGGMSSRADAEAFARAWEPAE